MVYSPVDIFIDCVCAVIQNRLTGKAFLIIGLIENATDMVPVEPMVSILRYVDSPFAPHASYCYPGFRSSRELLLEIGDFGFKLGIALGVLISLAPPSEHEPNKSPYEPEEAKN